MVDLEIGPARLRGVRLVIFDKDGTLIELYPYIARTVFRRARRVGEALGLTPGEEAGLVRALGVEVEGRRIRPEGPAGIRPRGEVLAAAIDYLERIGRPGADIICREAFAAVDELSARDPAPFIRPARGAIPLVKALRKQGCRVAVATQDLTERGRLALKFLGLEEQIDALVGADRVSHPKPHPEAILFLLAELAVPAAQAVMVGDASTDLEMAKRAGLSAAIGVRGGITPEEALRAATPYVVEDLSAIRVRPAAKGR
ncbi:MAG: HAD family hydrolase [Desulfobacterales bacterium]